MKKFNHLNIPRQWEQYWSKYPNGYSILEALIDWVGQVDDMVDNQNHLNGTVETYGNRLDDFIDQFDTNLQGTVSDTLSDWQGTGFLDVVISQALDTKYHEMNNRLTAQIGQKASNSDLNQAIAGISEGTPLFADSIGQMTDVSRLYVNTSDGMLYRYDGTAFITTGMEYQATGIANKSVTTTKIGDGEVKPKNTSFAKIGNNLANFIESGVVLASQTPNRRTEYEGGWVSDLIPVEVGDELTLNRINRYMLYSDSLGIYDNKLLNGVETTITIPSGVSYVIVDTFGGFTSGAIVNFGSEALPYEPYTVTIDNLALPEGALNQSWENKRVDWIGDSLLENNQTATKNTYDYVTENLQLDSNNLGVSGTGYATSVSSTRFYERVSQVRTNTDLVVFCGSGNDVSSTLPLGESSDTDTTTVAGCINTAIGNVIERVPMAKIGIITSPPWQSSQLDNDEGTLFGNYTLMLKKIAYERGIPLLDLYHESGMRPWEETFRNNFYKHDNGGGTHPDEDGHYKFMYPPTREFIKTLI